ncbi:NUDIX hydrolase [Streptomyces flaveolus]|uniref:NUDIX hydrolase n=1 Tax=Streptomyces flaveolus TaxID=67297 RepID=A0ABV3A9N0_9ACTN|nr:MULTISPECIES: NUDIX hydrolase [Streptomyces]KMS91196.1 NTP pyrophosphohydrolase [Streptomyces regensis]KOG69061.1 NTP pyrophosphohydrolase [Streptomyces antibioticus]MBG7698814.1 NUDIX hydrolase [Streptomyces sp. MC1]
MNRYEALRRDVPEWFRDDPEGVRILTDPALIRDARRQATAAGHTGHGGVFGALWARLRAVLRPVPEGVVSADRYLWYLRDPVRFPDGRLGLYDRILPPPGSTPGVVVLPLLGPEKKVVLIEHHRHATRSRHWEVVRGFGHPGATPTENVTRELREEIAATPTAVIPLGELHPDTGLLAHKVSLYAACVDRIGPVEKGEAIHRAVTVTPAEAEEMVADGRITDGFTVAALYRARLAGVLGTPAPDDGT